MLCAPLFYDLEEDVHTKDDILDTDHLLQHHKTSLHSTQPQHSTPRPQHYVPQLEPHYQKQLPTPTPTPTQTSEFENSSAGCFLDPSEVLQPLLPLTPLSTRRASSAVSTLHPESPTNDPFGTVSNTQMQINSMDMMEMLPTTHTQLTPLPSFFLKFLEQGPNSSTQASNAHHSTLGNGTRRRMRRRSSSIPMTLLQRSASISIHTSTATDVDSEWPDLCRMFNVHTTLDLGLENIMGKAINPVSATPNSALSETNQLEQLITAIRHRNKQKSEHQQHIRQQHIKNMTVRDYPSPGLVHAIDNRFKDFNFSNPACTNEVLQTRMQGSFFPFLHEHQRNGTEEVNGMTKKEFSQVEMDSAVESQCPMVNDLKKSWEDLQNTSLFQDSCL